VFLISLVAQSGANTIMDVPIVMTTKDFVYKTVEGLDIAATVYWPQDGLNNINTKLPIGKIVHPCLNWKDRVVLTVYQNSNWISCRRLHYRIQVSLQSRRDKASPRPWIRCCVGGLSSLSTSHALRGSYPGCEGCFSLDEDNASRSNSQ
jgi:hypothetical protein